MNQKTALALVLLWGISASSAAMAQSGSLLQPRPGYGRPPGDPRTMTPAEPENRPLQLDQFYTYNPPPPPRVLKEHDIRSVRVDEMARVRSDGSIDRRKNAVYDALLSDWVYLIGLKAIKPSPQADGDPRVNGRLNSLNRAEGEMELNESLAFNIAAQIVDIRPNGNLVIEARKHIRVNNEVWELSLQGQCRPEDIGPDNVVLSRDILDLQVDKEERGHVRDSYRRGWVVKLLDRFQPF